jgi:hypothetical protein
LGWCRWRRPRRVCLPSAIAGQVLIRRSGTGTKMAKLFYHSVRNYGRKRTMEFLKAVCVLVAPADDMPPPIATPLPIADAFILPLGSRNFLHPCGPGAKARLGCRQDGLRDRSAGRDARH